MHPVKLASLVSVGLLCTTATYVACQCFLPGTPAQGTGTDLPTPTLGMWLASASGPTIATVQAAAKGYNHITYFFAAEEDGQSTGTLTLDLNGGSYAGSSAALVSDITAWKASTDAKGHRRTVTVGVTDTFTGAGTAQYLTPTNATNAFNSLVSIINTYGFDGIEWDLESGDGNSGTAWNKTTIESINSQLKAHFGSGFLIGQSPRPFEIRAGSVKRGWMSAFDYSVTQDYFGADNGNGAFACGQIQALEGGTDGNAEGLSQFINGTDGGVTVVASKIILGNYVTGGTQSGCTPAQYETAYANLAATYPGVRGAQVWQSGPDAANGYTFGTAFRAFFGL